MLLVGCSNENKVNNNDVNVYDYYSGVQREKADEDEKIYLWKKGNMPKITNYTENIGNYFDEPIFLPYMTIYNVPNGTKVKGPKNSKYDTNIKQYI